MIVTFLISVGVDDNHEGSWGGGWAQVDGCGVGE